MRLTPLLTVALLATAVVAQTTNIAGSHQLTLNGTGAGATGPIPILVSTGAGISQAWSGLPNSPIILALAAFSTPNTMVIGAGNTLDLDLATFRFFLDGTGLFLPSPLAPYLHTNGGGNMNFFVPNAPFNVGLNYGVQGAFLNPGYPAGIHTTAAFDVSGVLDPNLSFGNPIANAAATSVGTGDDLSFLTTLNWGFTFYGTTYTQMWVGTNGYITSASFNGLGESAADFLGSTYAPMAKICAWWDDLYVDPAAPYNGSLKFYTDGISYAEYTWTTVRQFGNTDSNSFKITLTPSAVVIDYGAMGALDGLVGLSPGGATPLAVGLPLNLSMGNQLPPFNQTATLEAPYQLFSGAGGVNNNDLAGRQITFLLSATGVPQVIL